MRTLVISGVVVIVTMIGSLTLLIETGKDPSQIVQFLTPYLSLAIPVLVNTWASVKAKETLTRVDNNVNGHLTTLSKAAGLPVDDTPDPSK